MPSTSTAAEVRQAVEELQTEAYRQHGKRLQTLPYAFVKAARRHPLRFAMGDANKSLSFGSALTRSVFLARRLRPVWEGQEMVGILLPPSLAGALVNFAAMMNGKIPVNLNYTLSSEGIASCARQCSIKTVITSRAFLDRVPIEMPGRTVLLEELPANPGLGERLTALAMAWLLPASMLIRRKVQPEDLATVVFSSGSTGDPKGVMLTQDNVVSNIAQLDQCVGFDKRERFLGVLPFFHSFGFTGTLALPLTLERGVVFHPSPFDAKTIGELVEQYGVTFLLATPTFLQGYIRRCEPEQFGSLRMVLVGAEKLQERTAQAFEDRFGIRPLEAYGCTECSPAVTVNTRDFRAAGFRQVGGKRGKIGGEMVPHTKVEEKLQELADAQEQVFAVTGGPDEKKGERLLVLHTLNEDLLQDCIARLGQTGLPNLWLPRPQAFFKVDAIPYLGTGKLDLRKVRQLATQLARG
jgi:acyl-[acyl-carrier-protein]-phospholipid O-acyltransferase/long-chain-fatty-acid--[acyl-carrier-protein] ligase